jgi:hypothetical protein
MIVAPTPLLLLALAPAPAEPVYEFTPRPLEAAFFESLPQAGQRPSRRMTPDWHPQWVLALGTHWVDADTETFRNGSPDEDQAYSIDFVLYNWDAERGMGLEFGYLKSSYTVTASGVGVDDHVDVHRAMLGIRMADRGSDNPIYVPYVRGGLMYRRDDGEQPHHPQGSGSPDDDGWGWYLGGGIDFRFGSHVALTPTLLYSDNPSRNTQEWVYGILLSVGF